MKFIRMGAGRDGAGMVRAFVVRIGVWGLCSLIVFGGLVGGSSAAEQTPLQARMAGKQTTIRGQQMPVAQLLRALGQQAGVNVIVDEVIDETITLDLKNVSLLDAFQVILEAKKLHSRESSQVILVGRAEAFQADQRDVITERLCSSYGGVGEYLKELEMARSETGTITVSADGNCLVVRDHQANVQRLQELLNDLDQPLPQVHIKARIVTIEKSVLKQLGIAWGYTGTNRTLWDPLATRVGKDQLSAAYAGGNLAFGLIRDNWSLDVDLSALQENKQLRVLSAPRVVVMDGHEAVIQQGTEVPYETGTSENPITAFKDALLSLKVTPKILRNHFVQLKVVVTNNSVNTDQSSITSTPSLNRQEISTSLLLEDGVTAVIGGILSTDEDIENGKVPGLGDIPLLGYLFKNSDEYEKTYELFVFLTPTIIKPEHGYVGRMAPAADGNSQVDSVPMVYESMEREASMPHVPMAKDSR